MLLHMNLMSSFSCPFRRVVSLVLFREGLEKVFLTCSPSLLQKSDFFHLSLTGAIFQASHFVHTFFLKTDAWNRPFQVLHSPFQVGQEGHLPCLTSGVPIMTFQRDGGVGFLFLQKHHSDNLVSLNLSIFFLKLLMPSWSFPVWFFPHKSRCFEFSFI